MTSRDSSDRALTVAPAKGTLAHPNINRRSLESSRWPKSQVNIIQRLSSFWGSSYIKVSKQRKGRNLMSRKLKKQPWYSGTVNKDKRKLIKRRPGNRSGTG